MTGMELSGFQRMTLHPITFKDVGLRRITLTICLILLSATSFSNSLEDRGGTGDGSEEWGYIPLRPGASMFYWFYRTTHPDGHLSRPVVLWLQGGPGLSGTGLGNFLEIGPLDQNLEPRNSSWLQSVNILFVDSPVHSGFSIAENSSNIPDNIYKISQDLIRFLQTFMAEHPYFHDNPLYIFGQSYGGKMTAALAYYLNEEIKAGNIRCNLRGAAIGNGFVSPVDFIQQFAPLTYEMGIIDFEQYETFSGMALSIQNDTDNGLWKSAHSTLLDIWGTYDLTTLSAYNILQFSRNDPGYTDIYNNDIDNLMNGAIREKLGIIPKEKDWEQLFSKVYFMQADSGDVLKPVWHLVDDLLKNSDLDIVVYQGQLDLICNTAGAISWIQKLTWPDLKEYNSAERKTLVNPETQIPEMFVKSHRNLKMFWILNSGHVVPADVPDVALRMLNRIIDGVD